MSGTEIVATTTTRYVILRRLTPPSAGAVHACTVDHAQHLGFDTVHWAVEHDGTDRAAWETAAKSLGVEIPTT